MRWTTSLKIALAFVGLIVGAGFATGQETIQYFISFGSIGIWGAVLSGVLMTAAGAVTIQLGSYFLADDHGKVFSNVAHPVISRFLDVSVTFTLFSVGFVMLAGAGSTLEQQFGLASWIGAGIMTLLVILVGQLDVDRVSSVISAVTPLIILAIVAAFVFTLLNMPSELSSLDGIAQQSESPVRPWWLSAANYTGMNLLVAVSMCLVIGGSTPNTREAAWGGLMGGLIYLMLVIMSAVLLFLNIDVVGQAEVPMLAIFDAIHPVASTVMVIIVFLMIFNTAIGMFYALGRRVTVRAPQRYRPVFIVLCLVGYALSFVGFSTLMSLLYPIIGYVGMFMMAVFVIWSLRRRVQIVKETGRRDRIRALLTLREDPRRTYTQGHEKSLKRYAGESVADDDAITGAIDVEVIKAQQKQRDADGPGPAADGQGTDPSTPGADASGPGGSSRA